jgi:hypothetical protein
MFAVLTIDKDTQFSKDARATGNYWTQLIPARSLEEVEEIVEPNLDGETNTRVVIYELAEPTTVRRLSLSSTAPRPRVTIKRDGSFA